MGKQITLSIPTNWNDISLKKYLRLQTELSNYSDDEDAMTAIMLQTLCGLDAKYISGLALNDFLMIRNELNQFISNTQHELNRIVEWKGVKYGFEPNLSQMNYGAYLDISKYDSIAIDDNWSKVMNILYRPIVEQKGDMYSIEPYNVTNDNVKEIEQWGMDIHFGALFFFLHLSTDLVTSIPNYLKEVETHPHIRQILEKSGEVTKQLFNLHQGTSLSSEK